MPQFSISTGIPTLQTTITSLTLGYGANMTAPPDLLLWDCSSGGTVTLPAINPVLPTAPGTPSTSPGVGDGLKITIKNQTGNALTITPAGSDTIDAVFANDAGSIVTLQASTTQKNWYNLAGSGSGNIRSATASTTILTTDRYLLVPTASFAVTVPAPSNFPVGAPFVTIINTSTGSITVTPASGNIQTQAAFTITTLKEATILTDGTNFFLSAQ